MADDELAAIVRRNYEALGQGDPQPLLESLAPDYRYTCHTRNRFDGRFDTMSMLQMLMRTAQVQSDLRLEIVDVRGVDGDMVVLHYRASFTVGERRIENANCISVVAFDNGKIVDAVDINSAALNNWWRNTGDPDDETYAIHA